MSEVLVASGATGRLRYFGTAILIDISDSGLALFMDHAPKGYAILHVRNKYLEAEVAVRNTTSIPGGIRVGGEFVKKPHWQEERI